MIGLLLYSVHTYYILDIYEILPPGWTELNISHTKCLRAGRKSPKTLSALMDGKHMHWKFFWDNSGVILGVTFCLKCHLTGIASFFSDLICCVERGSFPPGLNEVLTVAEIF